MTLDDRLTANFNYPSEFRQDLCIIVYIRKQEQWATETGIGFYKFNLF